MKTPQNQKQLVIYYLLRNKEITLRDVINDSMFHKFQTRLSEIEAVFGQIAERKRIKFINRFEHKSDYLEYKGCVSVEKLREIYNYYG